MRLRYWTVSRASSIQSTFLHPIFRTRFNNILPSNCRTKIVYIFVFLTSLMLATSPAHLILLGLITFVVELITY
jgi:hypothetical protein